MKTHIEPLDVKGFGQVFTPIDIVQRMLELRKNKGRILEPACGDGAFLRQLGKNAVGLEIDPYLVRTIEREGSSSIFNIDFFDYPITEKFDTVIGNPPYVRFQDIFPKTKKILPMENFDKRTNLYLFFIQKSVMHLNEGGELIFITPRNFISATAAKKLNNWLYENGTITHFYDLGDARIFDGVAPNCAIWRWVKGRKSRRISDGRMFKCNNGLIYFEEKKFNSTVGDYFQVRVGAVSGADDVFISEKPSATEFVCSKTAITGQTRNMIYNDNDDSLRPHKPRLLNRRIRHFDDSNWWEWGRAYHRSDEPRLYVNNKTRNPTPFFEHKAKAWDGSVLALFPHDKMDLRDALEALNSSNWAGAGFVCGGRFLFSQRSLENAPFVFQESA